MRIRFLLLPILLCLASLGWGQEYYSIEPASLPPSVPFAASLRNFLDPQGTRLMGSPGGEKTTICEVWWGKSVSSFAKPRGPEDASYSNLEPGALLGVVHFAADATDGRGQKLRSGYYTMRYVLLPRDKAHETVMEYPDFVALSPAALDTKNRERLPMDALLLLSRRASHRRHPAVMSLAPFNPGYQDFPGLVPQETGEATLQIKIRTHTRERNAADMKMAIVLVPAPKHDIGS